MPHRRFIAHRLRETEEKEIEELSVEKRTDAPLVAGFFKIEEFFLVQPHFVLDRLQRLRTRLFSRVSPGGILRHQRKQDKSKQHDPQHSRNGQENAADNISPHGVRSTNCTNFYPPRTPRALRIRRKTLRVLRALGGPSSSSPLWIIFCPPSFPAAS